MIDDIDLIVSVAIDYYQNNISQTDIAKKIHASRPTVSNLLKRAKELGIVKIYIHHPQYKKHKQQSIIKEKYQLDTVLITSDGGDPNHQKELVGKACANYLKNHLPNLKQIGIGWGTTLYEFVEAMPPLKHPAIEIVSLMGGFGIENVKFHSNHLTYKLAERLQGTPIFFNAPAIAESIEIKHIFKQSQLFSDMMAKTDQLDAIILGVGNPTESSTYRKLGFIDEGNAQDLERKGAIVDILANFYNQAMEEVPSDLSDRMIGLPLDHIKKAKKRIILASGEEKIPALRTLLTSDFVTVLIIDEAIANGLC